MDSKDKTMDGRWNKMIKGWKELRSHADGLIKVNLDAHFPSKYGYANPMDVTNKRNELVIGRALWVYARSDLTIKTMELEQQSNGNFKKTM